MLAHLDKCIAYPCVAVRAKKSGFCAKHKAVHSKSKWVKTFRALNILIAKEKANK